MVFLQAQSLKKRQMYRLCRGREEAQNFPPWAINDRSQHGGLEYEDDIREAVAMDGRYFLWAS